MKQCSHCLATFEDTVNECPEDNCALHTAQELNPLIGSILADRYKIISVLGSGGMGTVYKAQHLAMERIVALKLLHAHLATRANALKRFHAEAKTIAQLKHHNIITLYDFGISANGQPFLVMDYVDGSSLNKLVQENGPVPLEQISPILRQVLDGLSYAHSENVVHRDLKPENIMLTKTDQGHKVTLVDFGLALFSADNNGAAPMSKNSQLIGSPYYMSPEQCLKNGIVDNRCDIYSLAMVLYEALSGRLPYEKKSGISMMESHIFKQPLPFNLAQPSFKVCTELTRVFNQALAKEPENRYQTINEFGTAITEALERDAVKWRAIKHRAIAARQTMTNSGSVIDQDLITQENFDESLLDIQFQTGTKFLSRQAEIEATLFSNDQEDKTKKSSAKNISKEGLEKKQCLYCGAMMPAGILFCLSCQRKIQARPNKMSETFSCVPASALDPNGKDTGQMEQARSNIQSLRYSNLSTSLAKTQRVLIYAITAMLLVTLLMVCRSYVDVNQSVKYLSQFVGYAGKFAPNNTNSYVYRKRR